MILRSHARNDKAIGLLYQFRTKIKIGAEKIVHAGYAAHLFRTWAFYDEHFQMSVFVLLILMICKYFIHHFYVIYVICNVLTLELIS